MSGNQFDNNKGRSQELTSNSTEGLDLPLKQLVPFQFSPNIPYDEQFELGQELEPPTTMSLEPEWLTKRNQDPHPKYSSSNANNHIISVVTKVWPAAHHKYTKEELLALHKPTEIDDDLVNSLPTLLTKESLLPVALLPLELQEEQAARFNNLNRNRYQNRTPGSPAANMQPGMQNQMGRGRGRGRGRNETGEPRQFERGFERGPGGAFDKERQDKYRHPWNNDRRQQENASFKNSPSIRHPSRSNAEPWGSRDEKRSDGHESDEPRIRRPARELMWLYRDPQGEVQGPFSDLEMNEWFEAGYFTGNLLVKRVYQSQFLVLSSLPRHDSSPFFTLESDILPPNEEVVATPAPAPVVEEKPEPKVEEVVKPAVKQSPKREKKQQQQEKKKVVEPPKDTEHDILSERYGITPEPEVVPIVVPTSTNTPPPVQTPWVAPINAWQRPPPVPGPFPPQQMMMPPQQMPPQFLPQNNEPLKRKEGVFFIDESGSLRTVVVPNPVPAPFPVMQMMPGPGPTMMQGPPPPQQMPAWRTDSPRPIPLREIQEQEARKEEEERQKNRPPVVESPQVVHQQQHPQQEEQQEEIFWSAAPTTTSPPPQQWQNTPPQPRKEPPVSWAPVAKQQGVDLRAIQEEEFIRAEKQRQEMARQQEIMNREIKLKQEKERIVPQGTGWVNPEVKDQRSLREIQEEELREAQRKQKEHEQRTAEQRKLQQQQQQQMSQSAQASPRWGPGWDQPKKGPSLREIQEQELKQKPEVAVTEPAVTSWVNKTTSSEKSPISADEISSPKPAQKNSKKKETVVVLTTNKKDKSKAKKTPEKPPAPEPVKPVWGQSSSRPKSLKEIQEEELKKATKAAPAPAAQPVIAPTTSSESDFFWGVPEEEEKVVQQQQQAPVKTTSASASAVMTKIQENEFPTLATSKKAAAKPKPDELSDWCRKQIKIIAKVDDSSFTDQLLTIKTINEVKEYIKDLAGTSESANKFAEEFIKKRKGFLTAAPATPSSASAKASEKAKKKKGAKVSANHLLGFTVFNPNQGEIETLDE